MGLPASGARILPRVIFNGRIGWARCLSVDVAARGLSKRLCNHPPNLSSAEHLVFARRKCGKRCVRHVESGFVGYVDHNQGEETVPASVGGIPPSTGRFSLEDPRKATR